MISATDITNTIDELDVLFNANPAQVTYYSKLALLELCGWLELTMDCIIEDCSTAKLTSPGNIKFVKDTVIGSTYGFHYDQHFRPMLMKMIGLIKLEQIESGLSTSGDLNRLESTLGTLYQARKRAAHTNIDGTTLTYEAPSKIKFYLTTLFPILQQYEAQLQAI